MKPGAPLRGQRLALVAAYPPSEGPLSEYAWHLVESLRRSPRVERVHVLADRAPGAGVRQHGRAHVQPSWRFGSVRMPLDIVRALAPLDVDAVWFQLHLTSMGNTRLGCFSGLMAPLITRTAGYPTIVTLHNMLGLTDLREIALNVQRVDLWGAEIATWLACCADFVGVPRPEYAVRLGADLEKSHIRAIPLGTPGTPQLGEFDCRRSGILAFGHFGSNKRLEQVIAAAAELSATRSDAHLFVGGTSSRHRPQYLDGLQARYRGASYVTFLGYVAEEAVPRLFQSVKVSALPYATITGMSSVALQSAMYGASLVASDIPGFRALEREGLRMQFFGWGNQGSLTASLQRALDMCEVDRRRHQSDNLAYCRRQPLSAVVEQYLDEIDAILDRRRRNELSHEREVATQSS